MSSSLRLVRFVWLCLIGAGWLCAPTALAQVPARTVGFSQSGRLCIPDQECKLDSATFTDSLTLGIDRRVWAISGSPTSFTTTGATFRYSFQQPGNVRVSLTRYVGETPQPMVSRDVTIGVPPPSFRNWRTDTTICKGERITLDPYAGQQSTTFKYKWYPKGDTTQTLQVDSSGCYSVEVIDPRTGCSFQNRINVDVCGEQKEQQGVKWYFGGNAGLDFTGGQASPLDDGKLNTIEGSSSIADTKGRLLFYSDGISIFDKDGNPMPVRLPNGDTTQLPLGGNQRSSQSALIVPKPTCRGCEYLYYVYTTAEVRGTRQLTYSVVDMRENKGNGAVVSRPAPVTEGVQSTERSASVENERDSTFWVITHDYNSTCFRINHLTRNETPTSTTYCAGQAHDTPARGEGYMKIGPADTASTNQAIRPLAVVVPGDTVKKTPNVIDLFTFNDSTGKLEYQKTINLGPAPPKAYGVEFSPDGKSIFVSMLADTNANGTQKGPSFVLKYDISQKDTTAILASRTVIDSSNTRQYGALQIAPDGRIYVATKDKGTLGVIENPNGGLIDTLRFNPTGQALAGKQSQLGLPNLVANFTDQSSGPGVSVSDTCAGSPTTFQVGPNCPKLKETYTLTFGDGSAPKSFTTTSPVQHTYAQAGTYPITLRIQTFKRTGGLCKDTLIRDTITILARPNKFELGPDRQECKRSVELTISTEAQQYIWVFGGRVISRSRTIQASRTGTYIGFATNGECFRSDTVQLTLRRPAALDLGPDTTFCVGGTYVLRVPQTTYTSFRWSNGATTRDNPVTQPGSYSVVATYTISTDNITCENTDTISLRQLPRPTLNALLTAPTTCTAINGAISIIPAPANSGPYSFTWTAVTGTTLPGSTSAQTGLAEGLYRVQASGQPGCVADSSFGLRAVPNRLNVVAQPTAVLCSVPNSGGVNAQVSGGQATGFTWRTLAGAEIGRAQSLTNVSAGGYTVEAVDAGGCKAFARTAVGFDSTGFASLGPGRLKCIGDTTILIPQGAGQPGNVFQWSNGTTGAQLIVQQPGRYGVRLRNTITGCTGSALVDVGDRPRPNLNVTDVAAICVVDGGRTQLLATGNGLRFFWPTLNDTSARVTVSVVGQYVVQATDRFNCIARDTANVVNACEPIVFTPNAFTPNSDGVNDRFDVFARHISDFELKVFNRWGEVIFATTDPTAKWDGTYRGQLYPPMVYPFVLSYRSESFPARPRVVKRGTVALIR